MKIGVIGSGNWGKKIIKKLKELNYSVKIIKRKDNFKKEIDNFDTFFIVTDDKSHYKFLKLLKKTDKKIFCEKPISRKKIEIQKIKKFKLKNIFISDISNYYPNFNFKNKNFIYRSKIDKDKSNDTKKRFDLLYRFLYHDIGYLIKKLKNVKINKLKIINSKGYLELNFYIKNRFFNFKYVTNKKKTYTFNNKKVYSNKDNLKIMINDFLKNRFSSKKSLEKSFNISKILEIIELQMKKNN